MKISETKIPGLLVIEPTVYEDARGYFFESFNAQRWKQTGYEAPNFIQDNQSKSGKGVLRGLHYQLNPHAQSKLVRALEGRIFDVAVDIRKGSPTYGQWHGEELSAENKKQLFVPRGFAHGFSVLSQTAIVFYKCDGYYHKESERGIAYNDPALGIDWKLEGTGPLLSDKDKTHPPIANADTNFSF